LELAIGSCHQASEMIDDIRSLFRRVDEPGQPVDLNEVIAAVIHSHQQQLRRGKVEARHEPAAGLPLVRGHKAQLQEVVDNLVNNAIEAMATTTSGHRLLKLTTQRRGDDAIVVDVLDTGPGIDPARLDEIFDAFVTTKPQGTGLGLAICRMIIEHHGGELTASSDGRSGALFQFVLPV
jgi:signal transduction histidine kinase